MGGGMPIGAFISSAEIMNSLSHEPALGHITTFGGHPVCCAAALACLEIVTQNKLWERATAIGEVLRRKLVHPKIKALRVCGALAAVDFGEETINMEVIQKCIEKGVITDWFLFNSHSMRIAPPLIISDSELERACEVILEALD
jgi:acetylornithine/succinyldiaminopimelate/putrescine aminotransferase